MRLIDEETRRVAQIDFSHANDYPDERFQKNIARFIPVRVTEGEENIDHTGLMCPAHRCHTTNTDDYVWGQMISLLPKQGWPEVCADFPNEQMITEALAQTINADGCRLAPQSHNMWVATETLTKYACRHMKHPPPATQEGADWFYRQLVQSEFMKRADEQRFSTGLEALHFIQDFLDQGFESWTFQDVVFMIERIKPFLLTYVVFPINQSL